MAKSHFSWAPSRLATLAGFTLSLSACGGAGGSGLDQTPSGSEAPADPGSDPENSGIITGSGEPSGMLGGGDFGMPDPTGVDGESCGSVSIDTSVEEVITPGNVLIVFDQSGSMEDDFSTGQPKWIAANQAVVQALQPLANALTIGAVFFPTGPSLSFLLECDLNSVASMGVAPQIPFMPGTDFINAWQQYWQNPNLQIGTPLDAGMIRAAEALGTTPLQGQVAVIVVTDGEPTCFNAPPGHALDIASLWLQNAISTHVIGLPGAQNVQALSDLAVAGGTGQYLLPTDATALQQQISQITSTIVRRSLNDCAILFNEVPEDFDQVVLVVTDAMTGQKFRVDRGPAGWDLAADQGSATLQGPTCDDALNGRFSNIAFEFGCVDIPVLR